METVKLSFDIETSDATCPLAVNILMDNILVFSCNHVQDPITFVHEIPDNDGEHELRIVLAGKMSEHTDVDSSGLIIKDAVWTISNVSIDYLDVNQMFMEKCVYDHNFNGSQPDIKDTFHGVAGCNGTISFAFSSPIYLWLLGNM